MQGKQGTSQQKMSVLDAIRGRRSIGRVKAELPPREWIEGLLEAANWAPSHRATEPWRFVVLTGEGRSVLGEAYADIALEGLSDLPETELAGLRAKHAAKAFRAPVIVAAYVSPSGQPEVIRAEEFAAAHCAVQNLLLAAHAFGLGAIWRSGEPMYHPRMKQAFGLKPHEEMIGLIYIGYPDMNAPEGVRAAVQAKTRWVGEWT